MENRITSDGEMEDVSKELKAFLDYAIGRKSDDVFVRKLEEKFQLTEEAKEYIKNVE